MFNKAVTKQQTESSAPSTWLKLFFTALMFYTRLPCPAWTPYSEQELNRATVFFPVIGWVVGAISGVTLYLLIQTLGTYSAVLLSVVAGILVTGAFHEDGFADACDGFGGGWTREKILTIMKDSRIGVYGACGLLLMLLTKISLLADILGKTESNLTMVLLLMISAHSLSRLMPTGCIYFGHYARDNDDHGAKAKPMGKGLTTHQFLWACGMGLAPLIIWLFVDFHWVLMVAPATMTLISWRALVYFNRWIGGYTGDCLGALQQITEVVFYLCLAIGL